MTLVIVIANVERKRKRLWNLSDDKKRRTYRKDMNMKKTVVKHMARTESGARALPKEGNRYSTITEYGKICTGSFDRWYAQYEKCFASLNDDGTPHITWRKRWYSNNLKEVQKLLKKEIQARTYLNEVLKMTQTVLQQFIITDRNAHSLPKDGVKKVQT